MIIIGRLINQVVEYTRRLIGCGAGDDVAASDSSRLGQAQLQAISYLVTSEICNEGEMALQRGEYNLASDHFDRAFEIDPTLPRLTELRGLLALVTGKPCHALEILEANCSASARQKLLLQIVRLQAGLRALAHMELNSWSKDENCPASARILLAVLDAESGDIEGARQSLTRNIKNNCDPATYRMQFLIDVAQDLPQAARKTAGMLLYGFGYDRITGRFLASMSLSESVPDAEVPLETIEQLAGELVHRPEVIPTLVLGQKINPQPAKIELLRRSIRRIVDDLDQPTPAIQALAELADIAGDIDDLRRWVRHGLKLQPYSVRLAMMFNSLKPADDADEDQSPQDVLSRVAVAYPDYSDVQRAMVYRYVSDDAGDKALEYAKQWVDRCPDNRLAKKTLQELAA